MNPVRFGGIHTFTYPNTQYDPQRGTPAYKLAAFKARIEKKSPEALDAFLATQTPKGKPTPTVDEVLAKYAATVEKPEHTMTDGDPGHWAPAPGKFATPFSDVFLTLRKHPGVYKLIPLMSPEQVTWRVHCADENDKAVIQFFRQCQGTPICETHTPFGEANSTASHAGERAVQWPVPGSPLKQVLTLWEPETVAK